MVGSSGLRYTLNPKPEETTKGHEKKKVELDRGDFGLELLLCLFLSLSYEEFKIGVLVFSLFEGLGLGCRV